MSTISPLKQKVSAQLDTQLFAIPTPAGAFFATANSVPSSQKDFLYQLIINNHNHTISQDSILQWGGENELKSSIQIFYRLQQLGYIQGNPNQPESIPSGKLDEILANIIAPLSSNNKAILADSNGLYIATSGYPHEVAEELAAMSIDLNSLYQRHEKLLVNNLNIATGALAMVAPNGYSQLGFWPIHIGENLFFLILGGVPQLQHDSFTILVKLLATKYMQ